MANIQGDLVVVGNITGHNIYDRKPVATITTANIDLSADLINGAIFNNYTVSTGDRVGVVVQTNAAENGIYIVPASGAASRSTDANTDAQIIHGISFFVLYGDQAGFQYILETIDPIILDTTDLSFIQSASYLPGIGLLLDNKTFNVNFGTNPGLENASGLRAKVDNDSIEINTNKISVKNGGIANRHIGGGITYNKLVTAAFVDFVSGDFVSGIYIYPQSTHGLGASRGYSIIVQDANGIDISSTVKRSADQTTGDISIEVSSGYEFDGRLLIQRLN